MSFAVIVAGAGLASDARAAGLELVWDAPVECPNGERVRADIEALAGRDLSGDGADGTTVSATVALEDPAWVAVLSIASRGAAPNERRIEGKTCREVADAVAAIVALALVTPTESPVVAPPPVVAPRVVASAERPPPPEEPSTFGGMVTALGGVDFAALPSPTPGFGASGAVRFFEQNRIELRVIGFLPQTEAVADAGIDLALFTGALRYCRVLFGSVASVTVCGGFEGGAMVATAFGFDANEGGVGRWLAPELAIQFEVHPLREFGLHLEVEGLAPLARDYFLVDEDRLYRPPAVDVRSLLGASFSAP